MPLRFAILILVSAMFILQDHRACAQNESGRPIHVEQFSVNRLVDGTRFVQSAAFMNTAEGDFILEFMASVGEANERWTVTFENDASSDYVQSVQVNAQWRYTIGYGDAAENPTLGLAVPSLNATVTVLEICDDTDFNLFKAIAIQTANDRAVVSEVLASMPFTVFPESEDPPQNCHFNCYETWTLPYCPPEPGNPKQALACCVAGKMFNYCRDMCECARAPDPQTQAVCETAAYKKYLNGLQLCLWGGVEELVSATCP